jgi:hypothetical protein
MLHVTFKGGPFLFTGNSLEDSGAITTVEDFMQGRVSFAHYRPQPPPGLVKRYNEVIGTRADLVVIGVAKIPPMNLGDILGALDNMWGGDPNWVQPPKRVGPPTKKGKS